MAAARLSFITTLPLRSQKSFGVRYSFRRSTLITASFPFDPTIWYPAGVVLVADLDDTPRCIIDHYVSAAFRAIHRRRLGPAPGTIRRDPNRRRVYRLSNLLLCPAAGGELCRDLIIYVNGDFPPSGLHIRVGPRPTYPPHIVPTGISTSVELTLPPSPSLRRDTSMKPPWAWMRSPFGPADATSPSFLPRTAPKGAAMIFLASNK